MVKKWTILLTGMHQACIRIVSLALNQKTSNFSDMASDMWLFSAT